ncbi:MAG: ADP-ribose pyrophosphatase [Kiritimatiellia bacterium]|jgi:ADP-ribose pyrophosphatase
MNENRNPWQTLSSKVVYDNPWIHVVEHQVIHPAGSEGIYGVVQYKNIATGVIPLDEENNTWLVGQYRYPLEQYSWEIPEGGGAKGADPLIAVQRELREETGITAKDWQLIQVMHLSNSVSDEIAYLYIARDLTFGETEHEDSEELAIRKVPFSEVYRMVLEGEITDTMTVTAVLRAALVLDAGAK